MYGLGSALNAPPCADHLATHAKVPDFGVDLAGEAGPVGVTSGHGQAAAKLSEPTVGAVAPEARGESPLAEATRPVVPLGGKGSSRRTGAPITLRTAQSCAAGRDRGMG